MEDCDRINLWLRLILCFTYCYCS